jgi:chromosome segregation ATPase
MSFGMLQSLLDLNVDFRSGTRLAILGYFRNEIMYQLSKAHTMTALERDMKRLEDEVHELNIERADIEERMRQIDVRLAELRKGLAALRDKEARLAKRHMASNVTRVKP